MKHQCADVLLCLYSQLLVADNDIKTVSHSLGAGVFLISPPSEVDIDRSARRSVIILFPYWRL